jgi:hypothetical protein
LTTAHTQTGRAKVAELDFSVSRTGGDLSLPESALRVVQPSHFPVYDTGIPVDPIEPSHP